MSTLEHLPLTGPIAPFVVDTTKSSFIHRAGWLTGARSSTDAPSMLRTYVLTAILGYLPLVLVAALGSIPLAVETETLRLPILKDWNVLFMFCVTLPSLVLLLTSDHTTLNRALERLQGDGILDIDAGAADALAGSWAQRFQRANLLGQALGVTTGVVVMTFNYLAYVPASTGYWIAEHGRLLPVGYVFLLAIFVFYALIPVYIVRSVCTSLLLKDVVKHSTLRLLPFHPDRCGGLRPVGWLGLRNQYGLTVCGLNVVTLSAVSLLYLNVAPVLLGLIVAAAVGYVVLGPIVFIGPLLPFRAGLLKTKAEIMGEVAQRLRTELDRLRSQLPSGDISRRDEALLDRLQKLGRLVEDLPVWPFDAGTLRRFLTAYVVPLVGVGAYMGLKLLVDLVLERLVG